MLLLIVTDNNLACYSLPMNHVSSAELLKIWNEREAALVAEEGTDMEKTLCGCLATRPLAVRLFLVFHSNNNYFSFVSSLCA